MNKITVRKDGMLWRVDCPRGDVPRDRRFWALHLFALLYAFSHAESRHGSG